ncbi:MAG: SRPBCC family protein [Beijerinckiaceae bacterium]|jgi:uncharacterized protein YndB with AHSA1/START domain
MRMITILAAAALVGAGTAAAQAASVTKSIDVNAPPAAVWEAIGPFCSIKDWHPAIGQCTTDGKTPPARTLVTKDGKATFVETETARDDKADTYSYKIDSSPLPLTGYVSTISVAANATGGSTIKWTSTFTPASGKDDAASDAVGGIYQGGLDAIKAKFAK